MPRVERPKNIQCNTDRTIIGIDLSISDIPAHALRVGDTFGEHTVWMCGPGERLEIKHVATEREVFCHWSTSLGRVDSQPTQRSVQTIIL